MDCCLKGDWSYVQALVESAQNEYGTCIELNGRDEVRFLMSKLYMLLTSVPSI